MEQTEQAVPLKIDPDAMDYGDASCLWSETSSTDSLFSCSFDTFCNEYCTKSVNEEDVAGCIEYLSNAVNTTYQTAILEKIADHYEWNPQLLFTIEGSEPSDERPAKRSKLADYDSPVQAPKRSPVDRYAPLFAIMRAIYSYGSGLTDAPVNPYQVKQYPHELQNGYTGYGIAQGCVAEAEWDSELEWKMAHATPVSHGEKNYETEDGRTYYVPAGRIVVPITCCHLNLIKVREVLIMTAQHVFQNDPRRMWMYSMSVDGHKAYLWFFTRTHFVKIDPIDWVEDINGFVHLLLTLALSSPKELGIDPYVHRLPGSQDYIYEVNGNFTIPEGSAENASDTPSSVAFYRTVDEVMAPGSFCLTFKTTRVFKVVRVHSLENPSPIVEGQYAIIKDIWLDECIPTEFENQQRMFAAVDAFIASPDWKSDRRLKDFNTKMLERLENLFVERRYRSLFLNTLHAWRGIKSPALSENIDYVVHHSGWDGKKLRHPPIPETLYVPKQQTRFIYAEVCTPLTSLKTLGEVMDIIGQTTTALQVLLCAGWVHRDISIGNIMAYRTSAQDSWAVKLTDFEFAKALGDVERLPVGLGEGTAIGTREFMAHEIYRRSYEFARLHLSERAKASEYFNPSSTLAVQLGATGEAAEALSNFKEIEGFDELYSGSPSDVSALIPSDADLNQALHLDRSFFRTIVHNYQHDLESLWWITLWFITGRVRHEASLQFAKRIFDNGSYSAVRADVFRWGDKDGNRYEQDTWSFHPDLQGPFADFISKLRKGMVMDTYLRPIMGQLMLPSSYSAIHALFAAQFEELNQMKEEPWAKMSVR